MIESGYIKIGTKVRFKYNDEVEGIKIESHHAQRAVSIVGTERIGWVTQIDFDHVPNRIVLMIKDQIGLSYCVDLQEVKEILKD